MAADIFSSLYEKGEELLDDRKEDLEEEAWRHLCEDLYDLFHGYTELR